MKKAITLLLCSAALFGKANAADGDKFTVGQFTFTVLSEEEKTVKVSGYTEGDETVVEIPSVATNNGVEYTVTTLNGAIKSTTKVTKIIIPNSVTTLGVNSIYKNAALKEIVFPENSIKVIGGSSITYNEGLETLTLPNSVDSIGTYAFFHNSALKTIKLPESLRVLGNSALSSCSALTEVTIPESVRKLDTHAFRGCYYLKSLHIPAGVTTIGEGLAISCDRLKTITVDPKNEYFIVEDGVLYDKDKTRIITVPSGNSALKVYVVPPKVTEITEYIFSRNTYITSITVHDGVKSIGQAAFMHCTKLKEMKLPSRVKDIPSYFFYGCIALEKLEMNNLRSIASNSFYNTTALKEVYYNCMQPLDVEGTIFNAKTFENGTLYVPAEQVDNAKLTNPWCKFPNIVAYDFNSGVEDVNTDAQNAPIEVYNFNGMKVADSTDNLPTGLYIVRQNGKTTKISVTSNY